MFCHCVASCYIIPLPAAPPCLGCFLLKVASDHQTTEMVIYHYNKSPVNSLNCGYVISQTYKVKTIYGLSSVVVIGSLTMSMTNLFT